MENPQERISGNGSAGPITALRLPSGIGQTEAIRAFERAGGILRNSKRGHAVIKMPNGRLVSLPTGPLKRGLLERQIKVGGLTVAEFSGFLKGAT